MATREGEANYCYLSRDPRASLLITAIDVLGDPNSLDEIEPNGLSTDVAKGKSPLLSPEQGRIRMELIAAGEEYSLDFKLHPDLDEPPVLLARIKGEAMPNAVLGEASVNDPTLRDWVVKVMDFLWEKPKVEPISELHSFSVVAKYPVVACSGHWNRHLRR